MKFLSPKYTILFMLIAYHFDAIALIERGSSPKKRNPASEIEAVIDDANELIFQKQFERAVGLLQPQEEKLSRRGLLILAKAYAGKGDSLKRFRTLELCLAKNPNDYHVQKELGDAYTEGKKYDEAIAAYRESINLNARYEAAYEGLALAYEKMKDANEARASYERLIKVFGAKPNYLTRLCQLYVNDGFLGDAIYICSNAIGKSPENPVNHLNLAKAYRDQDQAEKAKGVIVKAASRFPASEPVQSLAGQVQFDRKDMTKAAQHFELAVKADPKSAAAHLGYAQALFELQKFDQALPAFLQACKLDRTKVQTEFRKSMFKLKERGQMNLFLKYQDGADECR